MKTFRHRPRTTTFQLSNAEFAPQSVVACIKKHISADELIFRPDL